ncbi:bacteriocin biosynthesis cyclodehydratase domain-containing protein [Prauserella shujinwangii]|uniref:Bacteriocin biosynthesis cyclodehydratase domain-containing protein n=1 Tax=Prauserella shujinwangii TaxID=1453103 RepID=A0A2T0M322_9PSEU|nr:hypothetical protein [Prauserella shujinwangii]PRX51112.1 bacteriocin biosynthesis cyclodehydratase domain-containing protein [Prauserella shujinwangii]
MSAVLADPAWRVDAHDDGLLLYAGADLAYLVPDLPRTHVTALVSWFASAARNPAEPGLLPDELAPVVRHLRSLGALRPAVLPTPERPRSLAVAVRVLGAGGTALRDALAAAFPAPAEPGLTLVVRTTATLRELAGLAAELTGPHLLLDLACHHTVSLGPLVVPGGSACLACLAVRTGRRWGDPPPPPEPAVTTAPEFAAALARHAVGRLESGSLALLERVVTVHTDELTSTAETVLPAAGCPVCPALPAGPATLPWEDR